MKPRTFLLYGLLLNLGSLPGCSQPEDQPSPRNGSSTVAENLQSVAERQAESRESDGILRMLLTERRDVLREMEEHAYWMHSIGRGDFADTLSAVSARLQGELELLDSPKERMAIIQSQLQKVREIESSMSAMLHAERIGVNDMRPFVAERLRMQILLERERLASEAQRPTRGPEDGGE